ncbi:MAG: hypothetical protein C0620_01660 [Desulfuromonas sp.]|nr:MAG: hypothetical protein C0620_01660 [Desulfuromonas sp.]
MLDTTLMVVEDDQVLRDRLDRILGREIRQVKSYSGPTEALGDLENFVPDIVLTDIKMPGMTGLEMVKAIRQTLPNIPVIIASAFSDPDYFMTSIRLKVENYVVKPIDVEQLMETIETIVKRLQAQKLLKEKDSLLQQYKNIVDLSASIVMINRQGLITYVNDRFCDLSNYKRQALLGQPYNKVWHPDMPEGFFRDFWKTVTKQKVWQGIMKNRQPDGSTFYVDSTIAPVLNVDGTTNEYISINVDISDLILSKKQLEQDIVTDRLTELPNRIKLQQDLKDFDDFTILMIDLDHFKEVNLLFGIHFGDRVLQFFADTLRRMAQPFNISCYRIASDEYGLLAKSDRRESFRELVEEIKSEIETNPLQYEKVSFEIDFTCALLYCDQEKYNPVEQLQSTIEEAKTKRHFLLEHNADALLQKQYEENFEWTKKIKSGLHDDRVVVYFQPIYDIKENFISKYECLVRLIEPDGTVVPPALFLNAAKRSRHYRELTQTVITQACRAFSHRTESFSINLSIEDLTDEETLDFLIVSTERYQLQNRLIVEVLESEGIDNFSMIQTVFKRLTDAGLRLAIDDFGSGYSNFSYLVDLPISFLKIDGSLIRTIAEDSNARIIVQSIVMFAHKLGIKCVAEFVSSEEILQIVTELNIDFAQGFYIARPQAALDGCFCRTEE